MVPDPVCNGPDRRDPGLRQPGLPDLSRLINFFTLDSHRRLVDLPGYGYAKVAEATKRRWQDSLEAYLIQRRCLRGLILLANHDTQMGR